MSFEELRRAVVYYMAEDHLDWQDVHLQTIADLCGVEPGEVAFTWKWEEAARQLAREVDDDPGGDF